MYPSLNRDKECHAIPFDISSRKLQGGLSGKAFPYFFISGLLFVIVESLSHAWLFFDSWTVAPQPPLSMGFFREKLEWVAISSSRESSQPRDWVRSPEAPVCTTGRYFTAEPLEWPYFRPKGGQIFAGKCSHQSWERRHMVPSRHCGRCFTITTTCHQSFQTGLLKLTSQIKSLRRSQRV